MNEKINVLGVNIDSFTAKEAMKETIAFLESEPVSVIDVVSAGLKMACTASNREISSL